MRQLRNPCKAIIEVAIAIIVSKILVYVSLLRIVLVVCTESSEVFLVKSHIRSTAITTPPAIRAIFILLISLTSTSECLIQINLQKSTFLRRREWLV